MVSVAFDTLKFARTLRDKAKFSAEQAEGLVDAISETLQSDIATKGDILAIQADGSAIRADLREMEVRFSATSAGTQKEFDTKIDGVEQRLEAKIDGVEQRLQAKIDGVEQRLEARIDGVEQRLEAKIEATELRLESKIEATKADILKWMFGTIGFQTVLILGAVIALARTMTK